MPVYASSSDSFSTAWSVHRASHTRGHKSNTHWTAPFNPTHRELVAAGGTAIEYQSSRLAVEAVEHHCFALGSGIVWVSFLVRYITGLSAAARTRIASAAIFKDYYIGSLEIHKGNIAAFSVPVLRHGDDLCKRILQSLRERFVTLTCIS